MAESHEDYVDLLSRMATLPADRTKALTEAASWGRDQVDDALRRQRSNREAAERVTKQLDQVKDGLRRLEARTGLVDAIEPSDTPHDIESLPRYLEAMLRDLESAGQAQAWVERSNAEVSMMAARAAALPATPAFVPAIAAPAPKPVARAGADRRVLITAIVAVVVVAAVVIYMLVRK